MSKNTKKPTMRDLSVSGKKSARIKGGDDSTGSGSTGGLASTDDLLSTGGLGGSTGGGSTGGGSTGGGSTGGVRPPPRR